MDKIKVIYCGEEYYCDWFDQEMITHNEAKKLFCIKIHEGDVTHYVSFEEIEKVVHN